MTRVTIRRISVARSPTSRGTSFVAPGAGSVPKMVLIVEDDDDLRDLAALARHPNQVLSHNQLLEMAWGDSVNRSRQQVKLYVGYLRRKLADAAAEAPIETVRGFGYRYRPTAPA